MWKGIVCLTCCLVTHLCAHQTEDQNAVTNPLYFLDHQAVNITPEAGPRVDRSWNPVLTADFIYWRVNQEGMAHALSGFSVGVPKGKVHDLNWEWSPGVKLGIGFNLPHDGWDLRAEYTWVESDARNSTTASNMISYWSIGGKPSVQISRSAASWSVSFNDLYFDLGRNTYLSKYWKLRPHCGLQGCWIDQDYRVEETIVDSGEASRLSIDQAFWGGGLRAGVDTAWQFNRYFSLYGALDLSLLWGRFDIDRKDRFIDSTDVVETALDVGSDFYTCEPIIHAGLGLRWERWFSADQIHLSLSAGWEQQVWISHNQVIKIPTETDHAGDFVLQGLTVSSRLDF